MMFALVIVAGKAFAQSADVPWETMEFTYTATGLTADEGDDVEFILTPYASTDPTTNPVSMGASAGLGVWYAVSATFENITSTSVAIDITWGVDAAINEAVGDDYKLWVVIDDGVSGCSNYRYLV